MLVFIVVAFIIKPQLAYSAGVGNIPLNQIVPGANALNVHDLDTLKQMQFEKKEKQDFIEDKKNQQKEQNIPSKEENTKQTIPISQKAKVTEYATKGVYISNVVFTKSVIFKPEELNKFANMIKNKNVFIEDILGMVNEINYAYADKGFVTARAFLVQQKITNGTVKIVLVEGKVGEVKVKDNRWTKDKYIKARISEKSGDLFNVVKLEQDLMKFNRYNDGVKLKASLFPGTENGTTDVNIDTAEEFPFHLTGLFDNAGRDTIGKLRGGLVGQADSLFGYRDRLMLGSYISRSSVTPFGDYNIPVNKYDGRVGFMYSSSLADITSGDYSMFKIRSRSQNFSAYYTQPLVRKPKFELNATASANYKVATTSFDGYDLYTDKVSAAEFALNAKYNSKRGIWYASQSVYQAFPIFEKESKYFKYEGSLIRLHDFSHGIIGQFRSNYQYIPQDVVPYIDQFQSGGIATVRGYSEGLLIGKSGYFLSGELMFPILPSQITVKKHTKLEHKTAFLGKWVKGAVFMDHAGVFPFKGSGPGAEGINSSDLLLSGGMGLRIQLPGDFTARLYWGFPMIRNNHEQHQSIGRFHFELSLSPDFYRLMELKNSYEENKKYKNKNKKQNVKVKPESV
jgi:hemolysin activation/secretion protein